MNEVSGIYFKWFRHFDRLIYATNNTRYVLIFKIWNTVETCKCDLDKYSMQFSETAELNEIKLKLFEIYI